MTATGPAARMAVPPLVGFLLVSVYVIAEALGLHAFVRAAGDTVSEAAAAGHAARALQLIDEGQDPNARHHVREGFLDHDGHDLTPVEAAILGRRPELVRLLERSGATHTDSARASCFARLRLPELLPEFGGTSNGASDRDADVETTIKTCSAEETRP
jgi:hypothetical protein